MFAYRAVPKFIKRFKAPDYKDKNVFGVPLLIVLQRTGQPLPQCMLYAMRCLRRTAMDAVGIFRKSGVRSRIQKLRDQVESDKGVCLSDVIEVGNLDNRSLVVFIMVFNGFKGRAVICHVCFVLIRDPSHYHSAPS